MCFLPLLCHFSHSKLLSTFDVLKSYKIKRGLSELSDRPGVDLKCLMRGVVGAWPMFQKVMKTNWAQSLIVVLRFQPWFVIKKKKNGVIVITAVTAHFSLNEAGFTVLMN